MPDTATWVFSRNDAENISNNTIPMIQNLIFWYIQFNDNNRGIHGDSWVVCTKLILSTIFIYIERHSHRAAKWYVLKIFSPIRYFSIYFSNHLRDDLTNNNDMTDNALSLRYKTDQLCTTKTIWPNRYRMS